jgi:hypothetical protein
MINSAAVVASLVFVGVQLHRNTKSTRASSHHAVTEALNRVNFMWARDGGAAEIWLTGMSDRASLTPENRWRFDSMVRAYLHVYETMHVQVSLGAGDPGILAAEADGIRSIFSSASVQDWWTENPFGFSPEFRSHVSAVIQGNV